MKKIIALIVLIAAMSSCYDDYILDYEYDGVYFPNQVDVRTFVVGEGMKIQVGAALGGVRENDRDRVVNYQIDNSLINAEVFDLMKNGATYIKNSITGVTALKLIPTNYYTVSDNSKMVIKKGEHSGIVTIKPDSAKFLADATTLTAVYALPLRITTADADTVLKSKNYAVLGLKYENMLFGNYWHGGVTVEKDVDGKVLTTTNYFTSIPSPDSKAWALKTVEPFALTVNGVSGISSSSKPEMKLTLASNGSVTVSSMVGATYAVEADGTSTFNQAKLLQNRKVFLNYKYKNAAGNWCYATDTLTFRNRIRDGVNEWQDENPNNYK